MSHRDLKHRLEQDDTRDPRVALAAEIVRLRPAVPPVDPTFRANLRATLIADHPANRVKNPSPGRYRWRFAAVIVSVLVMLALLLLSPDVRTWAQGIIRHIGDLTITNDPSSPEQIRDGIITEIPPPTSHSNEGEVHTYRTAEEAAEAAGFPVYSPPDPIGKYAYFRYDVGNFSTAPTTVITHIEPALGPDLFKSIMITQTHVRDSPSRPFALGSEISVQDTEVQGYAALWVENAALSMIRGEPAPGPTPWVINENILFWEQDGFMFGMRGPSLSLEEALMIANAMTPYYPPSAE